MNVRLAHSCLTHFVCAVVLLAVADGSAQWSKAYEDGLKEANRSNWQSAANHFKRALELKAAPEMNALGESGITTFDYLPYYQLGRAQFFLGQFEQALASFDRSTAAGAIQNIPPLYQNLVILRSAAEAMQNARKTTPAESSQGDSLRIWLRLLDESYRRGRGERALSTEQLSQLSESLNPESRDALQTWFSAHPQDTMRAGRRSESAATSRDTTSLLEERAFAAFVQGRYRDAYQLFASLLRQRPGEPQWQNWLQRTESELARLNQPAIESSVAGSDTVFRSASPLILVVEPSDEMSRVRSDSLHFVAMISDDLGIASIEVVINGDLFLTERLDSLAIGENNALRFARKFPLVMGENEIVLTVSDLDDLQHTRSIRRRVIRQKPLVQTAQFWMLAGSGVLLLAGIAAGSRLIKNRIAFMHHYNPYIAGAPIRDREMFFGRENLIERVIRTLPNNSVMIYGQRRIGKTSFQLQLNQALQRADNPEFEFVPVMIDLQGVPENRFFSHLLEEIHDQLRGRLASERVTRDVRKNLSQREFVAGIREIIEVLQQRMSERHGGYGAKKVRLVLQIDEVDTLNRYSEQTNQKLRAVFMKSFSENLVAVMTGSQIRQHWESESSPWYNFFEQIPMPALSRHEVMELIHKPVSGFYRFEAAAAEKIWQASAGRPFIVQKFCVRLINLAIEQKRRKVTAGDVDSIWREVLEDTQ